MIPLLPLYAAGVAMRSAGLYFGLEPVRRLRWPVVSIGNLSTGGTGKTPFTIALATLLLREGIHVDVLSRGYGRTSTEVERVNVSGSAEQFGDEPLLIARRTGVPVYVGAQRYRAGRLAEREASSKTGVHLLDDGFQHRQLGRQVDIVLVSSEDLADSLLPAGNLRETVPALRRASVLAVAVGDDSAVERLQSLGLGLRLDQPVWRYRREMVTPEIPKSLAARPVVAFCGIARPEQFFSGLAQHGFEVAASRTFPDHHPFTGKDLAVLRRLVETTGSGALVTTAKDLFRLGDLATTLDSAGPIFAVDLQVVFEDEAGIAAWLERILGLPVTGSS
jgi:tetraacyldisaccharide 4'-kinase